MLEGLVECYLCLIFFSSLTLTAATTSNPELETTITYNVTDTVTAHNFTGGREFMLPEGMTYATFPMVAFTTTTCLLLLILCLYYRRRYKMYRCKYRRNSLQVDTSFGRRGRRATESRDHTYQYVNISSSLQQTITTIRTQAGRVQVDFEDSYCSLQHGHAHYVNPEQNEDALYDQLQRIQIRYLLRNDIRLGSIIGSGQFGEVLSGTWSSARGRVEVAVKTLKKAATEMERVKFLQEVAIMGQFKHPSIVTMHGVIIDHEPMLLILELLSKGDLRNHLLTSWSCSNNETEKMHTFLSYCRQVIAGMTYLANKNFVHRDLAARNILVSDQDTCKIGDFGMSRDLMNEECYVSHGGMIPVKWTAPEAICYKKYSTASDVWSFGVLLFEIWSIGKKPFETYENSQILGLLTSGYRLPPPPGCPRTIYSIMIECWHPDPNERPCFEDIGQTMSQSDLKLLMCPTVKIVHPKSATLGSNLDSGKELYPDLQSTYKYFSFSI